MTRAVPRGALTLLAGCLVLPAPAPAQTVSGALFEDLNADGVWDPGEPPVADVPIGLLGTRSNGSPFDVFTASSADGSYLLSPGDGCYVVDLADPPGWRLAPVRRDRMPETTPGYLFPVGLPRYGKLELGPSHLRSGALLYAAMGDSIAWNFNFCNYPERFWYSRRLRDRLACAAPAAAVTLDEAAVKGEHTDDLLVDDTASDHNNVFRIMETRPHLISLSMIGNDLLDVDVSNPTQAQVNTAVAEILDARRNLQEALSVMVSEVPQADIVLNTLYDNLAYNCPSTASSPFHRTWLPIINQILRDLAWGQQRRISMVEAAPDFGQEGLAGECTGFEGLICRNFLDNIHPDNDGYTLMREKIWEATGGVSLGAGDALGRTSTGGVNFGFLRKVRTLFPTTWAGANGAVVQFPAAALSGADGGAAASVSLGAGSEEFRLAGFPDYYDEIAMVKVVAGVRYRTTGATGDDLYRMEISPTGLFAPPPDHDFTPTNWNFATPLVGGGGPNQPTAKPDYPDARLLALPDVPAYREVSATLTLNPVEVPGAQDYLWPSPTHADLATTTFRLVAEPLAGTAGNDDYTVEIDAVWLDLYGWERTRPAPVEDLQVTSAAGGDLEISFREVPGAESYNVYFGRAAALRDTGYDHGAAAPAGPHCDLTTSPAGDGRRQASLAPSQQPGETSYLLVTARVDGMESPAGFSSAAVEIDRAQSVCP